MLLVLLKPRRDGRGRDAAVGLLIEVTSGAIVEASGTEALLGGTATDTEVESGGALIVSAGARVSIGCSIGAGSCDAAPESAFSSKG